MTTTGLNLLLATLVVAGPAPARARLPWAKPAASSCSGAAHCTKRIDQMSRRGGEWWVLSDIDNTLVSVLDRTRVAWNRWVAAEKRRGAAGDPVIQQLSKLSPLSVRYDGRQTALGMGLDPKRAERFHAYWDSYFWDSSNWTKHDSTINATYGLLLKAQQHRGKIAFVTGRNDLQGTRRQLRQLGFDLDSGNVELHCKPAGWGHTDAYKLSVVRSMQRKGRRIAFMLEDSPLTIRTLQDAAPRDLRGRVSQLAHRLSGGRLGRRPAAVAKDKRLLRRLDIVKVSSPVNPTHAPEHRDVPSISFSKLNGFTVKGTRTRLRRHTGLLSSHSAVRAARHR